jgi:uncharacterized membrane protein
MPTRPAPGCTGLGLFLAFLVLLPLFLADAVLAALARLGLSAGVSAFVAAGIFLGGAVNIPIRRVAGRVDAALPPTALFGLERLVPQLAPQRTYTVIAVNVGGALVPTAVAIYQLKLLAAAGAGALVAVVAAIALNTVVCWWVAKPIPNVGIGVPPLVPPLVAALSAMLLAPSAAPNVAFVAGVMGPLLGADLLHLRDVPKITTGQASIGGAGTFDGIVLSGLFATLLA